VAGGNAGLNRGSRGRTPPGETALIGRPRRRAVWHKLSIRTTPTTRYDSCSALTRRGFAASFPDYRDLVRLMTLPDSVTRASKARPGLRAGALGAAAAASLLLSPGAAALGLGNIVQQSALGEPFRSAGCCNRSLPNYAPATEARTFPASPRAIPHPACTTADEPANIHAVARRPQGCSVRVGALKAPTAMQKSSAAAAMMRPTWPRSRDSTTSSEMS